MEPTQNNNQPQKPIDTNPNPSPTTPTTDFQYVSSVNKNDTSPDPTSAVIDLEKNIPNKQEVVTKNPNDKEIIAKHISGGLAESWSKLGENNQVKEIGGIQFINTVNPIVSPQNPIKVATKPVRTAIRTYQNDVADAIKFNHASSIDVALAEKDKLQEMNIITRPAPAGTSPVVILFSILMILLGIAAIGLIVYFKVLPNLNNPTPTTTIPANIVNYHNILRTENKKEISISDLDHKKIPTLLKTTLESVVTDQNKFQEIILTDIQNSAVEQLDSEAFLNITGVAVPKSITDLMYKNFAYGFVGLEKNEPYLILYVSSSINNWSTLKNWEGYMLDNLKKIFGIDFELPVKTATSSQTIDSPATTSITTIKNAITKIATATKKIIQKATATTTATTTTATSTIENSVSTNYSGLFTMPEFKDKMIKNVNVRYLSNSKGITNFIYAQPDEQTIIFTTTEDAFKLIIDRLNASRGYRQ